MRTKNFSRLAESQIKKRMYKINDVQTIIQYSYEFYTGLEVYTVSNEVFLRQFDKKGKIGELRNISKKDFIDFLKKLQFTEKFQEIYYNHKKLFYGGFNA